MFEINQEEIISKQVTTPRSPEPLVYEHPLDELARICVKLDYLFNRIEQLPNSPANIRPKIGMLVDIMQLAQRPDLKSRFTSLFCQKIQQLEPLTQHAEIDLDALDAVLDQLKYMVHTFDSLEQGSLISGLQQNTLLNSIQQRIHNPGGDVPFETPAYFYWLSQPFDSCLTALNSWIAKTNTLKRTVRFYLELLRAYSKTKTTMATHGYFQEGLEHRNIALVRVMVHGNIPAYPVISASKLRLNVQFYQLNPEERDAGYGENVPLIIHYCS